MTDAKRIAYILNLYPALDTAFYRPGEMETLPEELRDLPTKFQQQLEKRETVLTMKAPDDKIAARSWEIHLAGGLLSTQLLPRLSDDKRQVTGLLKSAIQAERHIRTVIREEPMPDIKYYESLGLLFAQLLLGGAKPAKKGDNTVTKY
ncbi:MAG: hypothetical protein KGI29_03670 [Pseudomonadota bacterium]|nr:hypothetical protein [Pseudomonadota bacterium]MDE3037649.1 hypothetical protein [Pseudomonadota bacterium]